MMDIAHIIKPLFQLINFAVIIALVVYVFKKYLFDSIRAQKRAQHAIVASLKKTFYMLMRNYQMLNREIEHEQQLQYELKERVMRWRAYVESCQEQMVNEKAERGKALSNQMSEQIVQIQQHLVYKQVLPHAMKEARAQLIKQFDDPHKQQAYMAHAIQLLKKEHR